MSRLLQPYCSQCIVDRPLVKRAGKNLWILLLLPLIIIMVLSSHLSLAAHTEVPAHKNSLLRESHFTEGQPSTMGTSQVGLFVENVGQFDRIIRYQLLFCGCDDDRSFYPTQTAGSHSDQSIATAQSGVSAIAITDDGLWLTLMEKSSAPAATEPAEQDQLPPNDKSNSDHTLASDADTAEKADPATYAALQLHLSYSNANPKAQFVPFAPQQARINYLRGNEPSGWHTNVPTWGGVLVKALYPGIDLEISVLNGRLQQRLIVASTVDAKTLATVQLQIVGAEGITVEDDQVIVATTMGALALDRPYAITQRAAAQQATVPATPIAIIDAWGQPALDRTHSTAPQKVAPIAATTTYTSPPFNTQLHYGTFLGGGIHDQLVALAGDSAGSLYAVGETASTNFPATVGNVTLSGTRDGFVAKLQPNGNGAADLLYATYIGGNSEDLLTDLAVREDGSLTVIGTTSSTDFPTTDGGYQRTLRGATDGVVLTLAPDGATVHYGSYLGGNGEDNATALQLAADGQIWVTGATASTDFPLTPGALQTALSQGAGTFYDLFLTRLQGTGQGMAEVTYSTYLGGERKERALALAIDQTGAIYLAGKTDSAAFPVTTGAFDTSYNGVAEFLYDDAFAAKVTVDESGIGTLVYSTYIGGNDSDDARAIATDSSGALYLTGQTISANFPTTPSAFDTSYNGGTSGTGGDAYAAKLTPDGSRLEYATFLGGSWYEAGHDLAIDSAGQLYLVGETNSADFPVTTTAWDSSYTTTVLRYYDAFLARLAPDGTGLTYASYLGDAGVDIANTLLLEDIDRLTIGGWTSSTRFPTTPDAFAPAFHDDSLFTDPYDGFLSRFQLPTAAALAYRVGGRVTDANGLPTPTIRVDVKSSTGTLSRFAATESSGFWAVPQLPAGDYIVTPVQSGFTFAPISRTVTLPPNDISLDFVASVDNSGGTKPPLLIVHGNQSFSTSTYTCLTTPERYLGDKQRSTLGDLPDWFLADGDYEPYLARLDSGPAFTASIDANALCLFQQIDALYDGSGGQQVTIIAHSMGGLVARACLAYEGCRTKVRALYTMGSPHGGLNYNFLLRLYLATHWEVAKEGICRQQAPLCQFAVDEMLFFNLYTPNQDGVHYAFIGGDANPLFPGSLLYPTDGPNDGVVSAQSGIGHVPLFGAPLPTNWLVSDPPVVQYITDEAHFAFIGHAYYERRSLADGGTVQERSRSYACLRHLMEETAARSGTTPPAVCRPPDLVRAAAAQPTLQTTADLTGTISGGTAVTHTVTVDENSSALFSLFWTTGTLQLELITPAGELITPTVALENHEAITYTAPVTTTDFLQSAGYTIDEAPAGEWQLRITYPQPATGATDASHYVGFVSLDSPLALTVARDAQSYRPGATAMFTATITPSAAVVTDSVSVTGTLYLPNGAIETVDYVPSVAGGYYQSQFAVPADAGSVVMRTVAVGVRNGITFSRQVESVWQITPDHATVGDAITEIPTDTNGNDLYDYLVIAVPVSVTVPATYTLHASLTNSDTLIGSAVTVISATTAGSYVAELRFVGQDIAAAGIDGPYTVRNVALLNPALGDLPIQRVNELYTTAAYAAREFEAVLDSQIYLPVILR